MWGRIQWLTRLITQQLAKAAATVESHGAREVWAIVTHGILSGKAIDTINASCLSGVVVTNSECFQGPFLPYLSS